mmetsp:Transcript_9176/g.24715  ORF Transcript_9176/g.24715 Transcript_9176/m.24715 type:complete len:235 (+) Transcript_9176:250-954(+)
MLLPLLQSTRPAGPPAADVCASTMWSTTSCAAWSMSCSRFVPSIEGLLVAGEGLRWQVPPIVTLSGTPTMASTTASSTRALQAPPSSSEPFSRLSECPSSPCCPAPGCPKSCSLNPDRPWLSSADGAAASVLLCGAGSCRGCCWLAGPWPPALTHDAVLAAAASAVRVLEPPSAPPYTDADIPKLVRPLTIDAAAPPCKLAPEAAACAARCLAERRPAAGLKVDLPGGCGAPTA